MKKIALFILCTIGWLNADAQAIVAQLSLLSSNQQMVEEAVIDGFVILKQDYQLQDTVTGQCFGRNHRDEFGTGYAWGVKTRTGYATTDHFMRPWEYDHNYTSYRNSVYRPQVGKAAWRGIRAGNYKTLEYNAKDVTRIKDTEIYFVKDTTAVDAGFESDVTDGEKDGWLVWLSMPKDASIDSVAISLIIYRQKQTFDPRKSDYDIKAPDTNNTPLGGIYIVPDFSRVGQITFRMAGILAMQDNKWQLIRTAEYMDTLVPSDLPMLTPVATPKDATSRDEKKIGKKK